MIPIVLFRKIEWLNCGEGTCYDTIPIFETHTDTETGG
jgi:hypothetical protein